MRSPRAILLLTALLSLIALRPMHWATHAQCEHGGHGACASALASEHACGEHDHDADHDADRQQPPVDGDGDGESDCELCVAIDALHTDIPDASTHANYPLLEAQPRLACEVVVLSITANAALCARPPPSILG